MNYELAKKLKEAGFQCEDWRFFVENDKEPLPFPTLSELIEVCGDDFVSLFRVKCEEGIIWYAGGKDAITGKGGRGSTPEEAVAELWLKLNKK